MARTSTLHDKARRYDAGLNEGGEGYNPYTEPLRQAVRAQDEAEEARGLAAIAARQQAEDAEWTVDITQARRAAWNAWAKAQRGKVTPAHITAQVKAQGWTVEALKRQIARHGL